MAWRPGQVHLSCEGARSNGSTGHHKASSVSADPIGVKDRVRVPECLTSMCQPLARIAGPARSSRPPMMLAICGQLLPKARILSGPSRAFSASRIWVEVPVRPCGRAVPAAYRSITDDIGFYAGGRHPQGKALYVRIPVKGGFGRRRNAIHHALGELRRLHGGVQIGTGAKRQASLQPGAT